MQRLDAIDWTRQGILLLFLVSFLTMVFGSVYVLLAITVTLLPSDVAFLGMSSSGLCALDDCRVLDFFTHNRMSYGGALLAIGVMTVWLTSGPLRRYEAWAWWSLSLATAALYGSFLTFLVSDGYFDLTYGLFVGVGFPLSALGLALTYRRATGGASAASALRTPDLKQWLLHRPGRARLIIAGLAMGIVMAGVSILAIASSIVLVPQDQDFLGLDAAGVTRLSDQLTPLMAHDRAAYGGTMIAIGILFTATALYGLESNAGGARRALAVSGFTFYVSTLVVHFAIAYTDLIHLLPIYGGLTCLMVALTVLAWEVRGVSPPASTARQRQPA